MSSRSGTLAWAFFLSLVAVRRPTPSATASPAGRSAHPTLDIPGLNWLNDFLVHKLEWTGDVAHLPKIDFSQLPEQILLFLVVFGLLTLVIHALQRSASGRATLAVRSSEVAAEASGVAVNRYEDPDLRPVRRDRRASAARCSACSASSSATTTRAAARRAVLARARGDVRHPAPRRRAARRASRSPAGTAVFHWISSWSFLERRRRATR